MSDPMEMTPRDEIEALLPFYLNGTLDGAELARVEAWLETNPGAQSALAALEDEYSASVSANEAIELPNDALGQFGKALEAEAGPAGGGSAVSVLASLWEKLMGAPPALAWGTAVAALALLIVQAVLPVGQPISSFTEAGIETQVKASPYVLVVFAPGSDIADITSLLTETGASLGDGPKPGGIYQVNLPVKDLDAYDALSAKLAAAPIVVQVISGKKPIDTK